LFKQNVTQKLLKPFIVNNKNKEIPWQPLSKPLHRSKIALVTTAGVHLRNQQPFDVTAPKGDPTFREIPVDTMREDFVISHTHYDHSDADKDINCVFPITRLLELAKEGYIESVSPIHFGFMGFIQNSLHNQLISNTQIIAKTLLEHNINGVLLTGG
jgi:D-proline reductase (dithiol) PrdB